MASDSILDQYHGDPTLTVLLGSVLDRPATYAFLKSASFDAEAGETLPPSAYAWEEKRRFPVHSAQDTVASLIYRSKCASHVPKDVDEKLAQAVEAYGIDPALFTSVRTKVAAAPDVEYAVPSQGRLPLGNQAQVKLAEEVLLRDRNRLDLETAVEAFVRLEKAAAALGVTLQPEAVAYAGKTACDTAVLRDALEARQGATQGAHRDAYAKIASALPAGRVTDRDALVKLASRIHQIDQSAQIDRWYGKRLTDPMRSVFNETKLAGTTTDILMQLPPEIWAQADVPEMAELAQAGDPDAFAQAYATLPMDIKLVIEKQI